MFHFIKITRLSTTHRLFNVLNSKNYSSLLSNRCAVKEKRFIQKKYFSNENAKEENISFFKRILLYCQKKENYWKLGLLSVAISGSISLLIMISEWGPPERDNDGKEIEDEFSKDSMLIGYGRRFLRNCLAFNQSIRDPSNTKLLPDPVEPPYYQPPYTLILEMNGILVHPEWTFATGWRYKRRTALELFLQQVVPYYEIVVFTGENAMTAGPVLHQIDDKFQYISSRLFRDATRYQQGVHIKDLSCINRSLKKVIMIDWNKSAGKLQPRNQLCVKKWCGDETDHELIDLAAFLRMIAQKHPDDVRPVLEYYNSFEDPMAAFREKHAQLMEEHQRRQEDATKKISGKSSFLSGFRLR